MRTFLLLGLTFLILGGAFYAYLGYQGKSPSAVKTREKPEPYTGPKPEEDDSDYGGLREGKDPWVLYVDENGVVTRKFRAAEYLPQRDGTILVKKPEVWFNSAGGQRMHLTGTDGEVVIKDAPDLTAKSTDHSPPAPPSRGRINHVTVEIYSADSPVNVPDEVLTTDNIQFDNDTLLITTESFTDPAGKIVPRDQVPVHVRGKYDFDGRGLAMRWNETDGRLDTLEVAHGEQLVIKDASGISGFSDGGKPRRREGAKTDAKEGEGINPNSETRIPESNPNSEFRIPNSNGYAQTGNDFRHSDFGFRNSDFTPPPSFASVFAPSRLRGFPPSDDGDEAILLASADKQAAGDAIKGAKAKPKPPTAPKPLQPKAVRPKAARAPTGPTPYLVTFNEDVWVTQGEEIVANAERMEVDFLTKQDAGPATAPATTRSSADGTPRGTGAAPVVSAPPDNRPATESSTASEPAVARADAPPSTQPSATQPASKPSAPPVIVRWVGKLTIVPAPAGRRTLADSGSAIVTMLGKPVTIVHQIPEQKKRQEIRAASVTYFTADGGVSLGSSPESPQATLQEFADGATEPTSTLTTTSLQHSASQRLATLTGPGHVRVPADENAPDKGDLDVRWAKGAKVFLAGESSADSRELSVEHMELAGDVDVEHPQLSLKSEALGLFFNPTTRPATRLSRDVASTATAPSTKPSHEANPSAQLARVLANTGVSCRLTDAEGKWQAIEGDELELLTSPSATGQVQPRQVNVLGSAHAFDLDQDLRSDILQIALKPVSSPAATRPSGKAATRPAGGESGVELDNMLATGNVFAKSLKNDGSLATGDRLEVTMLDGEPHVRLTSAVGVARVIDAKNNVITGPVVTAQPKRSMAQVEGPGSVDAKMSDKEGAPPRDVKISWIDHAYFDGPANTIDAVGKIAFTTTDPDGTVVRSKGERVHIDLEEKPAATQPATKPAFVTMPATRPALAGSAITRPAVAALPATRPAVAKVRPTTRPATKAVDVDPMQINPMGQKQVKAVTLDGIKSDTPEGYAAVESTLTDDQGNILKRQQVEGPRIIFQSTGDARNPAHSVVVPAEGRMLMSDNRPADKRPAGDTGTGFDSGRGDTAFKWNEQFLYSELQHRATMTGDVLIVYRGAGKDEKPTSITAETVTADFEPPKPLAASGGRGSTAAPATRSGDKSSSLQLRKVTADGTALKPAEVSHDSGKLSAIQISYDPATHTIRAEGTPNNPAVYKPADGGAWVRASSLEWNTVTWNVNIVGMKARGGSR